MEELHRLSVKWWDAWERVPHEDQDRVNNHGLAWTMARIRILLEQRLAVIPSNLLQRRLPK